jgi:hypothetical protein
MHTELVSGIHPLVASLNFEQLKSKLLRGEDGDATDPHLLALQEREYRRFLTMKLLHPNEVLVPTKVADSFWHAHLLDTVSYHRDTQRLFGSYLHHFPYFGIRSEDDAVDLKQAFERTVSLYESTLGEAPARADASRCGDDHACHAPSDCACRVESACK